MKKKFIIKNQKQSSENPVFAIIDPVGIKAGMDYYDLSLLNSLSKLSIKTFLFSNFQKEMDDISVYMFFNPGIRLKFFKAFNLITGFLRSVFYCKFRKVDILILHSFSASFECLFRVVVARLFMLKVYLIVHDIFGFSGKELNFIRKSILNFFSCRLIVHNQYSLNKLSEILSPDFLGKIHVIKHGHYFLFLDNSSSRQDALKKLKLDPKREYILFFGQIKKVKGLDVLLKALPYVHEKIVLIIAGKPWKDNFSHYQKIIDDLDLHGRVKSFIRYISDEEKDFFFKVSDALIIPYKVIYQSGVMLMGMSYGLPIIASDLQPIREIIETNKNGVLFKTGDEISLAKEINTLLKDKNLREKIGSEALRTVKEDHSWDKIALQYLKILK